MGEQKQWKIEGDDESGLPYHLITTESSGLTYLGGLGNVTFDWAATPQPQINTMEGAVC